MQPPLSAEYRPYFQRYIDLVPQGDIIDVLKQQAKEVTDFFTTLPADIHDYRYADGKWSIKQVLLHITDTERVMSYRALVAARGDMGAILSSMDENLYAENAPYTGRTMGDILEEFAGVRAATLHLLANITEQQSVQRANNADGTYFTTRALAYIIAGHLLHHIQVIKDRYL
jgi:uncharacterized damage-inducible protein DinB